MFFREKSKRAANARKLGICGSSAVARSKGLEPPAYCLGGSRSIHLSYERMFDFISSLMRILFQRGVCYYAILGGVRSILLS